MPYEIRVEASWRPSVLSDAPHRPTPYEYVPAKVTIDGVTFQKVGLRKKGFIGSQDTTRPSLKIKLDLFEAGQKIDGLKTLTLNNNKQDVTLMNQYLGYRMFDQAQSPDRVVDSPR